MESVVDEITTDTDHKTKKSKRKVKDSKLISTLKDIKIQKIPLEPLPDERIPVIEKAEDATSNIGDILHPEKKVNLDARVKEIVEETYPDEIEPVKSKKSATEDDIIKENYEAGKKVRTKFNRIVQSVDRLVPQDGKLANKIKSAGDSISESSVGKSRLVFNKLKNLLAKQESAIKKTEIGKTIDKADLLRQFLKDTVDKERSMEQLNKLSRLGNELGNINKFNIKATSIYQRKSLELRYRALFLQKGFIETSKAHYDIFRSQLEAIVHNTGLPDFAKLKQSETFRQRLRETAVEKIQGKIKELGLRGLEKFKESDFAQEALEDFQNKVGRLAGGLDAYSASEEDNEGLGKSKSWLAGKAAGLAGRGIGSNILTGTGNFNLEKESSFDNKTKTSVVTVIPGLLGKILSETRALRTGKLEEDVVFDFERSVFTDKGKSREKVKNTVTQFYKDSQTTKHVESLVGKIEEGVEGGLSDKEKDELLKSLLKHTFKNKNLGIKNYLKSDLGKDIKDEDLLNKVKGALEPTIESDKERQKLNKYFINARKEFPGINKEFTDIINSGKAEELLKTGLITYNDKLERYEINNDKQLELLLKYKDERPETKTGGYKTDVNYSELKSELSKKLKEVKEKTTKSVGGSLSDRASNLFTKSKDRVSSVVGQASDKIGDSFNNTIDLVKPYSSMPKVDVEELQLLSGIAAQTAKEKGSSFISDLKDKTVSMVDGAGKPFSFNKDKEGDSATDKIKNFTSNLTDKAKTSASTAKDVIEETSAKLKDSISDYAKSAVEFAKDNVSSRTPGVDEKGTDDKSDKYKKENKGDYFNILTTISNKLDKLEEISYASDTQVEYLDGLMTSLEGLKSITASGLDVKVYEPIPDSLFGHFKQYMGRKASLAKKGFRAVGRAAILPFKLAGKLFTPVKFVTKMAGKGLSALASGYRKGFTKILDGMTKALSFVVTSALSPLGLPAKIIKSSTRFLFKQLFTKEGIVAKSVMGMKKNIGKAANLLLKGAVKTGSTVKSFTFGDRNKPIDLYLKDKEEPVIRANAMKMGLYVDQKTGKVIEKLSDITGTVTDSKGNVILSEQDIIDGVYDSKGKEVKLGKGVRKGIIPATLGLSVKTVKGATNLIRKKIKNYSKRKLGLVEQEEDEYSSPGHIPGTPMGSASTERGKGEGVTNNYLAETNTWLKKIHDLVEKMTPNYSPFDRDKSGNRDGSWKDRLKKREEEKLKKKEDKKEKKEKSEKFSFLDLLGKITGFLGPVIGSILSLGGGMGSMLLSGLGLGYGGYKLGKGVIGKVKDYFTNSKNKPKIKPRKFGKFNLRSLAKGKGKLGLLAALLGGSYLFSGDAEGAEGNNKEEPGLLGKVGNWFGNIKDSIFGIDDQDDEISGSNNVDSHTGGKTLAAATLAPVALAYGGKKIAAKTAHKVIEKRKQAKLTPDVNSTKVIKETGGWFSNMFSSLSDKLSKAKDYVVDKAVVAKDFVADNVKKAGSWLAKKFPVLGKMGSAALGMASKLLNNNVIKNLLSKVSLGSLKKIGSKLPGLGAIMGVFFAAKRAMAGDMVGAGAELVSGLATMIPGVGLAGSLGIDYWLAKRDAEVAGTELGSDAADVSLGAGAASLLLGKKAGKLAKIGSYAASGVQHGSIVTRLAAQQAEGGIYDEEGRYKGLADEPIEKTETGISGPSLTLTDNSIDRLTNNKIALYRFIMYGAEPDDKKTITQFKRLEDWITSRIVTLINPDLIEDKVKLTVNDIIKITGIEVDLNNKEQILNIKKWFANRFMKVFVKHMKAVFMNTGKLEPFDIVDRFNDNKLSVYAKEAWNVKGIDFSVSEIHDDGIFFNTKLTTKGFVIEYAPWDEVKKVNNIKNYLPPSKAELDRLRNQLSKNIDSYKDTGSVRALPRTNYPITSNVGSNPAINTNVSYTDKTGAIENTKIDKLIENRYVSPDIESEAPGTTTASNKRTEITNTRLIPLLATPLESPDGGMEYIKLKPGVSLNGLNKAMLDQLLSMAVDYGKITGGYILITSGFRSYQQQLNLKRKYGRRAAQPGNSMHEFGFAIDINSKTADQLEKLGLMRKYGFTRPVGGEPWHIEPVGIQPILAYIRNKKISWEERQARGEELTKASIGKGGGGQGTIAGVRKYSRNLKLALATMKPGVSKILKPKKSDNDFDISKTPDTLIAKNEVIKTTKSLAGDNEAPQIKGNGVVAKTDVGADGKPGVGITGDGSGQGGFIKVAAKKTVPGAINFEPQPAGTVHEEPGRATESKNMLEVTMGITSIDNTLKESLSVQRALLDIVKGKEKIVNGNVVEDADKSGLKKASSEPLPKPGVSLKRKLA
jgi:Icc-related predicted phosphoesterase